MAAKIVVDDAGCWIWTAAKDPTGYGRIWHTGTMKYAHRVAYELLVGPILPGLDLDHLCRVRACVNPLHLEPVTHRENLMRGDTLARAHHEGRFCGAETCRTCTRFRAPLAAAS
jgi:hypothetical protein